MRYGEVGPVRVEPLLHHQPLQSTVAPEAEPNDDRLDTREGPPAPGGTAHHQANDMLDRYDRLAALTGRQLTRAPARNQLNRGEFIPDAAGCATQKPIFDARSPRSRRCNALHFLIG